MNAALHDDKISFALRVNREQNSLSKKEKSTCSYVQKNNREVIHMSINELAELCNTSEASLVRLSQKLGYKGFQAMKISIAQDVIEPTMQIYEKLQEDDTVPTIVEKVFYSNIQALTDTLTVLKKNNIEKAVDLIIKSDHLVFYGVGGSSIIAQDAQHKFVRIGYLPLAFSDSNIQAMSAATLTEKDVVVIISHSGASSATLDVAAIAKDAGAQIITITNYSRCPLLKYSDIPLFTASPETEFKTEALSSRIAELVIVDSLFVGAVFKGYNKALLNMEKTRKALDSRKI